MAERFWLPSVKSAVPVSKYSVLMVLLLTVCGELGMTRNVMPKLQVCSRQGLEVRHQEWILGSTGLHDDYRKMTILMMVHICVGPHSSLEVQAIERTG